MNKVKFLYIAIAGLFLLNLGLLAFMAFGPKPGPPPHHGPPPKSAEQLLINNLRFNEEQAAQFRSLKREHKQQLDQLNNQLRASYKALYGLLKNDQINETKRDSILDEIKDKHTTINTLHLDHFADIKNIGDETQTVYFNDFIDEMSKRFLPPPPPGRRHK